MSGPAKQVAKATLQSVRPVLSSDSVDCRRRVLALYKAWSRQIPYIVLQFYLPKSEQECRAKLREEFLRNKDLKDIRTIDILVVKGRMELEETVNKWKNSNVLMRYWKGESLPPKPTTFLGKFLDGQQ